jgi:nucleoside phosphorylase
VTGILVATRGEAEMLIRRLTRTKKEGIHHYRGQIDGRSVAVYLTRPGIYSREQLRRFLRLYTFERIVSTGAVAALTTEFQRLDIVNIAETTTTDRRIITVSAEGRRVVTVPHLIQADAEKAHLRELTRAHVLDMETNTIAQIMAEAEFARIPFSALRVVDDLPGDALYLKKESQLRDITLRNPAKRLSIHEIIRFGIVDYWKISWRRRQVALAIFRAVKATI